jgi:hypothetical protein
MEENEEFAPEFPEYLERLSRELDFIEDDKRFEALRSMLMILLLN